MGIEDGSTLRWTKARERNRLKARYLIRSSVISRVVTVDAEDDSSRAHAVNCDDGDGAAAVMIDEDCGADNDDDDDAISTNSNIISSLNTHHHRKSSGNDIIRSSISNRNDNRNKQPSFSSTLALRDQHEINNNHIVANELAILRHYLERIIQNDVSSFSVAALAKHGHILERLSLLLLPKAAATSDAPHTSANAVSNNDTAHVGGNTLDFFNGNDPRHRHLMEMMSTSLPWEKTMSHSSQERPPQPQKQNPRSFQPTTLATSKYGRNYVTHRLVPYMQRIAMISTQQQQQQRRRRRTGRRTLTIFEYASLLGRHDIVTMLLLGGLDPTNLPEERDGSHGEEESVTVSSISSDASRSVLALLHNVPTGAKNENECNTNDHGDDDTGAGVREECCGSHRIPLSMWAYIVRAVIDMRMNGILDGDSCRVGDPTSISNANRDEEGVTKSLYCTVCNDDNNNNHHHQCGGKTIMFGPPCYHSFCEPCMWKHLVKHVPNCTNLKSNVVTCPICEEEFRGWLTIMCTDEERGKAVIADALTGTMEEQMDNVGIDSLFVLRGGTEQTETNSRKDRQQDQKKLRCKESLSKFLKLPATCTELKLSNKDKKKKKKRRDYAHGTWEEALHSSVSTMQSQSVRSDRFFKAVLSSPQLVAAYLDAGIDVNMQNIYGQTPLYLACWKGSLSVVQSLLEYGANAHIAANGGSTCYSIAKKNRRMEVLHLLEEKARMLPGSTISTTFGAETRTKEPSVISRKSGKVSILIDPAMDHPGAGACIVDDALSDKELLRLEDLWKSLPVSDASSDEAIIDNHRAVSSSQHGQFQGDIGDNKSAYRPTRYYYCDSEEWVQTMLAECVDAARMALLATKEKPHEEVSDEGISSNGSARRPSPPTSIFEHIRFLNYERPGGILPPHVDLCRVDRASGFRSTHTFILYLTDCGEGGGTALLHQLKDPRVLSVIQPKRGRALMFPHVCPHTGLEVVRAPKLLLRGEFLLDHPRSGTI